MGIKSQLIRKKGVWFTFGRFLIGKGRENSRQYLVTNTDIMKKLKIKIVKLISNKIEKYKLNKIHIKK